MYRPERWEVLGFLYQATRDLSQQARRQQQQSLQLRSVNYLSGRPGVRASEVVPRVFPQEGPSGLACPQSPSSNHSASADMPLPWAGVVSSMASC